MGTGRLAYWRACEARVASALNLDALAVRAFSRVVGIGLLDGLLLDLLFLFFLPLWQCIHRLTQRVRFYTSILYRETIHAYLRRVSIHVPLNQRPPIKTPSLSEMIARLHGAPWPRCVMYVYRRPALESNVILPPASRDERANPGPWWSRGHRPSGETLVALSR
jgi:hypothetical protein